MHFDTDAVAGTVSEGIAVSHLRDVVSGSLIHVGETGSRPYGLDASPVGLLYDLIDLSRLIRCLSQENGSRHIRAVTV